MVNADNFERDAATVHIGLMEKLQNLKFEMHFFLVFDTGRVVSSQQNTGTSMWQSTKKNFILMH